MSDEMGTSTLFSAVVGVSPVTRTQITQIRNSSGTISFEKGL
jgi:hypothetical protein